MFKFFVSACVLLISALAFVEAAYAVVGRMDP